MEYRTGKCSQCGAEYKVPASFAHNVARCKVCKGVVHLGPPQAASGAAAGSVGEAAAPARKAAPKPFAPRAAGAPHALGKSPSSGAPGPRPSSAQVPESAPSGAGPSAAEQREERAASRASEPARGARRTEAAANAPGPRPLAPAARKQADEGAAESGRARGRAAREQKKPPMVGILSGVGLLAVGLALYLFRGALFGSGAEKTAAVSSGATTGAAPGTPSEHTAEASKGDAGASTPVKTPVEDKAAREPAAPEPEKPKAARVPKDPSSIDLAAITDFQPTSDTTAEEWAQMMEWMAQWMDVDAGAAGNRAKLELLKLKRKAVPAILNFFKRQDFATKEGRSNGDQCQKTLMQICNGTNFDWRYADEAAGRPYTHPEDVYFCKRVVEEWTKAWRQAEQNIEAWINLAKLKEKDPEEAERLRAMFGGQSSTDPAKGDDDLEVD